MSSLTEYPVSPSKECEDSMNGNVLDRLKQETTGLHQELEAQLNLLSPTFADAEYTSLLSRFYGFYQPWEEKAWPILGRQLPSLVSGRRKVPALLADLQFLGKAPEAITVTRRLPALNTFVQALGSCYVLEGATLGGQLLCRHFGRTLGLRLEGLSFFRGYGDRTGIMWQSFRRDLLTHVSAFDEDAAVVSAIATFEALTAWLLGEEAA